MGHFQHHVSSWIHPDLKQELPAIYGGQFLSAGTCLSWVFFPSESRAPSGLAVRSSVSWEVPCKQGDLGNRRLPATL